MIIRELADPKEKSAVARTVLEGLTDWFAVEESREQYIREAAERLTFAAFDGNAPVGFLCLKETGKATAEIAVMGVLQPYHRRGVGRALFAAARDAAREMGYSFLQVKTVQMGRYPDYDDTNRFYQSLGFQEFEVFPTLWDEQNPCQVYVMSLADA